MASCGLFSWILCWDCKGTWNSHVVFVAVDTQCSGSHSIVEQLPSKGVCYALTKRKLTCSEWETVGGYTCLQNDPVFGIVTVNRRSNSESNFDVHAAHPPWFLQITCRSGRLCYCFWTWLLFMTFNWSFVSVVSGEMDPSADISSKCEDGQHGQRLGQRWSLLGLC